MLISKTYAEALVALPNVKWVPFLQKLAYIYQDEAFQKILNNPFIKHDIIIELISCCFKALSPDQKNIIKLIVRNNRLREIEKILSHYEKAILEKENKQFVDIITAKPATPKQKKLIEKFAITQLTAQTEAVYRYHVQKSLIGGFILRIDDYIINKSIATRLENISYNLQGT